MTAPSKAKLTIAAWRWRSETTAQIYQSNIGRLAAFNELSHVRTNAPCAGFSARGDYRVGMLGPVVAYPYEWEVFDARMFTSWLTDDELARVHRNGMQEIGRRDIPQWR